MNQMTVKRYIALFEALFLVVALPPWSDFRGLHNFSAIAGKRLRAGIVLYAGRETLPFGDRMWAVPLEALWAENR